MALFFFVLNVKSKFLYIGMNECGVNCTWKNVKRIQRADEIRFFLNTRSHSLSLSLLLRQKTLLADFSIKYFLFFIKRKISTRCSLHVKIWLLRMNKELRKIPFSSEQLDVAFLLLEHLRWCIEKNEKTCNVLDEEKKCLYTTWLNQVFFTSNLQQMKFHAVNVLFALWCVKREWINFLVCMMSGVQKKIE